MKISVVLSTNRPHYWPRFCQGLANNSVEFEPIFVGPSSLVDLPGLGMPVKFISTNANPALCWEMGARAATGDLLCLTVDDVSYTDGFFDDVVRNAAGTRARYDMFSARYVHNGTDQTPGQMMLGVRHMPLLPVGGVSYTEDHHRLGGVDRRFRATVWDTDLYMRYYQAGGRTTLLPAHAAHETGHDSTMFVRFSEQDKVVLRSLWGGDCGSLSRADPVQPYSEEEAGRISVSVPRRGGLVEI